MDKQDRYDGLFRFYAKGLDPLMLKAQAIAESNLDPKAVSHCGAEGIAQFMPDTWKDVMGAADPFNPESNIQAQGIYMRQLMARYVNDWEHAWAAYNWGMGNMDRCLRLHPGDWKDHLPDETKNYLKRIALIRLTLV